MRSTLIQEMAKRMISLSALLRKFDIYRQHSCNDLANYADVFQMLPEAEWQDVGLQNVPLNRIVGSAGRFHEFDLRFNPRRKAKDGRQARIAQAREQGRALPPPLLYKVAGAYFVEDGNHRISVARERGEMTIHAHVVEIDPVGLLFQPACSRLGFKIRAHEGNCGSTSSN